MCFHLNDDSSNHCIKLKTTIFCMLSSKFHYSVNLPRRHKLRRLSFFFTCVLLLLHSETLIVVTTTECFTMYLQRTITMRFNLTVHCKICISIQREKKRKINLCVESIIRTFIALILLKLAFSLNLIKLEMLSMRRCVCVCFSSQFLFILFVEICFS